jgi:hypothetical protein
MFFGRMTENADWLCRNLSCQSTLQLAFRVVQVSGVGATPSACGLCSAASPTLTQNLDFVISRCLDSACTGYLYY